MSVSLTQTSAKDHGLRYAGGPVGFLLAHGLGGTPVELRSLARGLNRAGHTVHCPQLAGHCASEADLAAASREDWLAGMEAELDLMRARCATIIVGGLSMGAVLGMQVAARRPKDVHGLALYAPTLWYDGWSIPWYSFLLKPLIDTPMGRRFRFVEREPFGIKDKRIRGHVLRAMESGDSSVAGLLGTPSAAVRQMWKLIADVRGTLGSIKAPALLVHAREDDVAGLSNAIHLQRHLGGLVDTLVLDDSYHLVTLDRQSDIVLDRSIRFAQWLGARRPRGALDEDAEAAE